MTVVALATEHIANMNLMYVGRPPVTLTTHLGRVLCVTTKAFVILHITEVKLCELEVDFQQVSFLLRTREVAEMWEPILQFGDVISDRGRVIQ